MTMPKIKFRATTLPRRTLACSLALGLPALLMACFGRPSSNGNRLAIPNLDSLHRVKEYNDSVEANYFFYEEAFTAYKAEFLGVDKPAYMAVARGKDQGFCLFRPDPGRLCLEVGDKFKSLGLGEPAREAYEAGLLSEGVNGDTVNIRLWSGMAELHLGMLEHELAKSYLTKVLEVDGKNVWARKMLDSAGIDIPVEEAKQKAVAPTYPGRAGTGKRPEKRRVQAKENVGRAPEPEAARSGPDEDVKVDFGLARLRMFGEAAGLDVSEDALD